MMTLAATVRSNLVHVRRRWKYAAAIRGAHVLVLRYHSVGEPGEVSRYIEPGLAVSLQRFRDHVRLLARRYHVVVPDDLPALLAERTAPSRPAVMITFDDGYADNYRNAVPVLLDEGVKAVFFITTAPLRSGKLVVDVRAETDCSTPCRRHAAPG